MPVQVGDTVTWVEGEERKRLTRTIITSAEFDRRTRKDNRGTYDRFMAASAPMSRKMIGRNAGDTFEIETGVGTKLVEIKRVEGGRYE